MCLDFLINGRYLYALTSQEVLIMVVIGFQAFNITFFSDVFYHAVTLRLRSVNESH